MKKKLIFLGLLILGFILFLILREFVFKREPDSGRIKIVSSPSAGVFIDNTAVGKTPMENKMPVGEYTIKLIPEGVSSDIAAWQGKILIYKDSLTYVNRELGTSDLTSAGEIFTVAPMEKKAKTPHTGEVYIETEPSGAIVYLDNDEKGVSPMVLKDVLKGDHEISVFLPGFFRRTQKINVDENVRTSAIFKLAVDETKKNLDELRKEKEKERVEKAKAASEAAKLNDGATLTGKTVTILDTETGFLRVRKEADFNSDEITKVKPGETYQYISEQDGWLNITVSEDKTGWISSDYAKKNN